MMDLLVLRTPAFCGLQWQKHTKVWLGPTLNSRLLKPQTKPFLPTSQVNPKPKPPKPCVVSGARTWKLWGFGLCGCDCRLQDGAGCGGFDSTVEAPRDLGRFLVWGLGFELGIPPSEACMHESTRFCGNARLFLWQLGCSEDLICGRRLASLKHASLWGCNCELGSLGSCS